MDSNVFILMIIIPLISAAMGSCISVLIMSRVLKEERLKFQKEHCININNEKIKNYKELFDLNKKVKILGEKIKNNTIPNWVNVESYYRDEFIMGFEELLNSYKFINSYIEDKKVNNYGENVLVICQIILTELRDRDNYGSASEKVDSYVDKLMDAICDIEKNILIRVSELSKERYK
ncbi:MAG: hypothetical protein RR891_08875 [Clostridium sp.]|uniref:hypothetical protein n=1 Tax=Clostridium sp. TaxID=1506 RepID=UPI003048633E